jgi:hypothetical protein
LLRKNRWEQIYTDGSGYAHCKEENQGAKRVFLVCVRGLSGFLGLFGFCYRGLASLLCFLCYIKPLLS